MANFWKSLQEAAGEYRTLLGMHQQEMRRAADVLTAEHRTTVGELSAALSAQLTVVDDSETISERMDTTLHTTLLQNYRAVDSARVQSVLTRLQAARPDRPPVRAVVLAWDELVGLVIFSDCIYLSTGLIEALPDDGALAFVLGHEIGHIDLGHNTFKVMPRLQGLPPMLPLRQGLGLLARAWMRPEMEQDADLYGFHLMTGAGYPPESFHPVFDVLAAAAIEKDLKHLVSREVSEQEEFWYQKLTGYPSLEARRDRLHQEAARYSP